jgi:transcription elongation factor GreA
VTQQPTDSNVVWLTQEGYDRLQEELDYLRGPARQELAIKIGLARDEGDLKENGGYHAAKDEQGKQEARIRQLEDMLRRAQVGEAPKDDGVVEPGMIVTVAFAPGDEQTFLLGSREIADFDSSVEHDVFSPQSPLGAAINGKKAGDTATYDAPNGKKLTVTIVEAKPFQQA